MITSWNQLPQFIEKNGYPKTIVMSKEDFQNLLGMLSPTYRKGAETGEFTVDSGPPFFFNTVVKMPEDDIRLLGNKRAEAEDARPDLIKWDE